MTSLTDYWPYYLISIPVLLASIPVVGLIYRPFIVFLAKKISVESMYKIEKSIGLYWYAVGVLIIGSKVSFLVAFSVCCILAGDAISKTKNSSVVKAWSNLTKLIKEQEKNNANN